ncbi:MAG: VWA domain-containing protein [Xanthomonadales bacterium]|nr:VWA domain-containing protein [Gammaproteobacteria bacterium]MBT8056158.1 VWA domain-containing protein [Gammaproteobacteria bacterium]NNJ79401.1 VWA domain-containing protein [Xanthomonadales bacterium]NNL05484.1 VWA domain-containing protein [Xanthomonadales bacterium]
MKTKILGIALFILTLGAVVYYPQLSATTGTMQPAINQHITANKPIVDVVFVLDTTGSMGGLIQTAKEKIWSIATTMASAQPTPEIRIGLVGFRDRGDAYVTRRVDLSGDLDSVYAALMDFKADGGGDTPESVNQALYEAVHHMSWSRADQAYQVIFLVGDAPPHMDYNEVQYPQIVANALERGIVINTIQCGEIAETATPWTQIANLGHGSFFQVEQAGGAIAFDTPYDERIAELSARLDDTRLYYGSREEKARMKEKVAATEKLHSSASVASRARRGVFNAGEGGRTNMLGDNELVDAIASGKLQLDEIDEDALPDAIREMEPEEQKEHVSQLAVERNELQQQIRELSEDRDGFIAKKVEEAGGMEDSLDRQLYATVKEQAADAGLEYEDVEKY